MSSSSEDSGTSEARNGDDEQSDWFLDAPTSSPSAPGPGQSEVQSQTPAAQPRERDGWLEADSTCMGVPLRGRLAHKPASPPLGVPESSDTDVSQSSWPAHIAFHSALPPAPSGKPLKVVFAHHRG